VAPTNLARSADARSFSKQAKSKGKLMSMLTCEALVTLRRPEDSPDMNSQLTKTSLDTIRSALAGVFFLHNEHQI
jgi:hypothetical protein